MASVKLWMTAAEIAALALPGLPTTKRNVNLLAERQGWSRFAGLCRPRAGRGGGVEYHVNLLPVAARTAYFRIHVTEQAAATGAAEAIQAAPEPVAGAGRAATLQLDARLAVLGALRDFIRSSGLKQTVAIGHFVDLYNLGHIDFPAWAAKVLPSLSARTLRRWLAAARKGETERLAVDKGAARRGQGVLDAAFDGEIKHFALAVHSFNELYTARQIYETIRAEFGARLAAAGMALPVQRAFEMRFKAWKQEHAAGLLRMMNPDGFRSKMRTSGTYAHLAPPSQRALADRRLAGGCALRRRPPLDLCLHRHLVAPHLPVRLEDTAFRGRAAADAQGDPRLGCARCGEDG